ncbi:MAG: NAD(P)H-hydrate epimerase [Gemmataceae bacterium]
MTPFCLSREQVREIDRRAIVGFGLPSAVLMENAGRGCADLFMKLNPDRKLTQIFCGPGNNGGDGFVIARHLDNHGWPVHVHVFAKNNQEPTDADVFFDVLFTAGIPFTQYHPAHFGETQKAYLNRRVFVPGCWIVDALFGTGLSRPLVSPYDWVVKQINETQDPVLSVDLPSGLDCDSGQPLGAAIQATHTATFVAWKKGFLHAEARNWTGEIHTIEIGVPRKLVEEYQV